MQQHRFVSTTIRHSWFFLLVPLVVFCGNALGAQADDFIGRWLVQTRLVAASAATNTDYRPGDIREDVWTFAWTQSGATLTTKDGTIAGIVSGTSAGFEAMIDTGLNLVMKIQINCYLTSSGSQKGTIRADYFGTFGNHVGLDSWTFEAVKI